MMVEQYDLKLWARVLHVNLTAPFMLSRACIPLLRKSEDASVMFTSTGVAQHGSAYWGAYGVSKAGADNLMQIMADELEVNTQIRVNSIDPGIVRTRMRPSRFAYRAPMWTPLHSVEQLRLSWSRGSVRRFDVARVGSRGPSPPFPCSAWV